jgi:hypothetical protein
MLIVIIVLLGNFCPKITIQVARACEKNRRLFKVFVLDTLKLGVNYGAMHFYNVIISVVLTSQVKKVDQCSW